MNGESGRAGKRRNPGPPAPRRVPQIVLLLQIEPQFGTAAKRIGKTQRHRGSDGSAAVENAGERGAGHFKPDSGLADGRPADPLTKQLTGVRRIVHSGHVHSLCQFQTHRVLCHKYSSLRSASWSSLDRDPNVLAEEKKETHQPLQ